MHWRKQDFLSRSVVYESETKIPKYILVGTSRIYFSLFGTLVMCPLSHSAILVSYFGIHIAVLDLRDSNRNDFSVQFSRLISSLYIKQVNSSLNKYLPI